MTQVKHIINLKGIDFARANLHIGIFSCSQTSHPQISKDNLTARVS
jgi:hypothetical protein